MSCQPKAITRADAQPSPEIVQTVVSERRIQASQSDEIQAREWGDIEKGKVKVKAPRA